MKVNDWFCGAGGSSEGAKNAGAEITHAANHNEIALETHSLNHPDTNHYQGDLMQADPSWFSYCDVLWLSPECRKHKGTKGNTRKNARQISFWTTEPDPDADTLRSRANAWTAVRFAEYHKYPLLVVENILEFRLYWEEWDDWIKSMTNLGYEYKVCYFNSQFFHPLNGQSTWAPTSRDRLYVVFWRKGMRAPDLEFKPLAYCDNCSADIKAVQSWKRATRTFGKYGPQGQYLYRCPQCAEVVSPYHFAAYNAIDWSLPVQRIGDRKRPLKPKTMNRIRAGLERFGDQHLVIHSAYTHSGNKYAANRVRTLYQSLPSLTTRLELGFLVSAQGDPKHSHAVLALDKTTPPLPTTDSPFVVQFRSNMDAASLEAPLSTVTSNGRHHALIIGYYPRDHTASTIDAPLPVVTTANRHGLLVPKPFMSTYNSSHYQTESVDNPTPTITTVDRVALTIPKDGWNIEDCGYRMFEPHECKAAQGFVEQYRIIGTKRQQVKQIGNAVTPPVAEFIFQAIGDII